MTNGTRIGALYLTLCVEWARVSRVWILNYSLLCASFRRTQAKNLHKTHPSFPIWNFGIVSPDRANKLNRQSLSAAVS